jgi:hypothetical protein
MIVDDIPSSSNNTHSNTSNFVFEVGYFWVVVISIQLFLFIQPLALVVLLPLI